MEIRSIVAALLLVALASAASPSKDATISLASVAFYCAIPNITYDGNSSRISNFNSTFNPNAINFDDLSSFAYIADIVAQVAIQDVNNNPLILPNITVRLERFTDCGPYKDGTNVNYDGSSSGYASSITAADVINSGVLGVIGNEFSSAAVGEAEILSNFKIPYCSGASSSPRFSNKNNYPYFWRTLAAAAIRATSDNLAKNSIHILANIAMVTAVDEISIAYAANEIESSDSRYIIISGQNQFVSQVYYGMGKLGMLNPTRVWMANNMPLPVFDNTKFQADYYPMLQGFVFIQYLRAATSGPKYDRLLASVMELGGGNFPPAFSPNWFFQIAATQLNYDCAMLMLLGFDRVLKSSPENTVEMLASRKLNDKLDFTFFQNLGYQGLVADPLELTNNGDLAVPFQAFSMTGVGSNMTVFGQTDVNATTFHYYPDAFPVFYGGSSIPPVDGPRLALPTKYQFATTNKGGKLMLFFIISGSLVTMSTLAFTFSFRHLKTVIRTSTTYLFATSVGCMSWVAAIVTLYLPAEGPLICVVQIGLELLGYCLIVAAVTSKMALNYTLLLRGRKIREKFSVILFLLWAFNSPHEMVNVGFLDFDRNSDTPTFISICTAPPKSGGVYTTILIIYNFLLLGASILLALRTLDVEVVTGESTFATLVVTILTFGGSLSALAVMANGHGSGRSSRGEMEVILVLAHSGCLWGLAMLVLAVVFVPKGAVVYFSWKARRRMTGIRLSTPQRLRLSVGASRVVAKASRGMEWLVSGHAQRKGSVMGGATGRRMSSGAGTGVVTSTVPRTTDHISPEIEFCALFFNQGIHLAKIVRAGQLGPSTWYLCQVAILKLHGRNWINLTHSQGVATFRFTYSLDVCNSTSTIQKVTRPKYHMVCITITPPRSTSTGSVVLWLEFAGDEKADEFVRMFQAVATISPRENDLLRNLMPSPSE
ncbi:periplasmic binding protein-like I [Chytriomyces cf. hyalinus JEL632]|nr:periplasmic binding protein-like I [Chytriomyces cf. hyalinus JEL632]